MDAHQSQRGLRGPSLINLVHNLNNLVYRFVLEYAQPVLVFLRFPSGRSQ